MRHVFVLHCDSHAHLVTSASVCVCLGAHVYRQNSHRGVRGASMNVNGGVAEQPLQSREEEEAC